MKLGARHLQNAGFKLSVFNVTSTHYTSPTRGWSGIEPEGAPTVGYLYRTAEGLKREGKPFDAFGGVIYTRNVKQAALQLGIAPPTTLPLYATSVHPIDARVDETRTSVGKTIRQ